MAGYNPSEARDYHGRWTGGGDSGRDKKSGAGRAPRGGGGVHSSMRGTRPGRPLGHSGAGFPGGGGSSGGGSGGGGFGSGSGFRSSQAGQTGSGRATKLTKGAVNAITKQRAIDAANRRGMRHGGGQDRYNRPNADVMQASDALAQQQYQVQIDSAAAASSAPGVTVNVTRNAPLVQQALQAEASGLGSHSAGVNQLPRRKFNSEKYVGHH
jgi:hypothetical protein